jgi:hypothetical protein
MNWSKASRIRSTTVEWSIEVRRHWGTGPSDRTFRDLTDAVQRLSNTDSGLSAAVRDIGAGLGAAGHALMDTTNWFADLIAVLPRRQRDRVSSWEHAVDLTEGWLAGTTQQERSVFGGVDGAELLLYRLHQQYDRCTALDVCAAHQFALIVIDLGQSRELDPATRLLANERLNDAIITEFRSGETVALFDNGRAVVLCERSEALPTMVRSLIETLKHTLGSHGDTAPHGWIEPLPLGRSHVAGLVAELAVGSGHAGQVVVRTT